MSLTTSLRVSNAFAMNGDPVTSCSANFTSMVYSPEERERERAVYKIKYTHTNTQTVLLEEKVAGEGKEAVKQ